MAMDEVIWLRNQVDKSFKGVNSNLDAPLNHLIWLNDYKTYGQDSYVFNDKDILHELYRNYPLCMSDGDLCAESFEYAYSIGEDGIALRHYYKISDDLKNALTNVNRICDSDDVILLFLKDSNSFTMNKNVSDQILDSEQFNNFIDAYPSVTIETTVSAATSSLKTTTISRNGLFYLKSIRNNIDGKSQYLSDYGATIYAFVRSGFSYTNVDGTVNSVTAAGATGSKAGSTTGTTSQPYSASVLTPRTLVTNVSVTGASYSYSNTSQCPLWVNSKAEFVVISE